MNDHVAAIFRTVARFGLGGGEAVSSEACLSTDDFRALLAEARAERLVGVLDAAVRAGAVAATEAQAEGLAAEAAQARRVVLELDDLLVEVSRLLDGAGVELRVLKGPAVARLDLPDRRQRSYADIDVLVRSASLATALDVLGSLGFARDLPERRPGFDRRFGKEVSLARADGREIDVHRQLALGGIGAAMDLEAVWSRAAELDVDGTPMAALDAEGRFVHACINASLGDPRPRIVALRDAVSIAQAHRLDPARVAELLPPGRGAAVLGRTRAHVRSRLGLDLPLPAIDDAASRWERAVLRCYRAEGGSNALELLSGTLGMGSVRDRVAFLAALAVPSPAYRRARADAGRPRELTTALTELASRRSAVATAAPEVVPSPTTLPSPRPDLAVAELDGQTVVWDPATARVTRLDEIASIVWSQLDGATPVAELAADLAFAFGTDASVVEDDVNRLLSRLVALGLAEWTRMDPCTTTS